MNHLTDFCGVTTIDCVDRGPNLAASFLIIDGDEAAFIDNNTAGAIPRLLAALAARGAAPACVKYIILTHAHLDHAGGTGRLLAHCPHATVLAHPLALSHLVQPLMLSLSSQAVFGKSNFAARFSGILAIPRHRTRAVVDGEQVWVGKRQLRFVFTPGHASHHCSIFDTSSSVLFAGDSLGALAFADSGRLLPLTPPTDFDLQAFLSSIDRMMQLAPESAFLTHFGRVPRIADLTDALKNDACAFYAIAEQSALRERERGAAQALCTQRLLGFVAAQAGPGLSLDRHRQALLAEELGVNALGLLASLGQEGARRNVAPVNCGAGGIEHGT